jgi:hypothetical protein
MVVPKREKHHPFSRRQTLKPIVLEATMWAAVCSYEKLALEVLMSWRVEHLEILLVEVHQPAKTGLAGEAGNPLLPQLETTLLLRGLRT